MCLPSKKKKSKVKHVLHLKNCGFSFSCKLLIAIVACIVSYIKVLYYKGI